MLQISSVSVFCVGHMCVFVCQCVSSLSVSVILCVNRVVDGAETAQVDIVLSCMGKRVACCVCGLRQAWGKPGSTGDIIDGKTTRLGITPSRSLPALPSAFIIQLPMNSSLHFTLFLLFNSLFLSPLPIPFFSSPPLFSHSTTPIFYLTDQ